MIIDGISYEFINELYNSTHDRYIVSVRRNDKYVRIPRAVWVRMTHNNKSVPNGYIIHHIDKQRKNDVISNLQLVTRGEHNKLHADDENHYMFRDGHSYWTHPKSEEHKKKIKEAHINRANKKREKLLEQMKQIIKDNINISSSELCNILGLGSNYHFTRGIGMTFRQLKNLLTP